jgi:hypothetical protein
MPQLDKLSFMSQYVWLTLFFFFLYFIVLDYFVVQVYTCVRFRYRINYITWYRWNIADPENGLFLIINNMRNLYFGKFNFLVLKRAALLIKKNLLFYFSRARFMFILKTLNIKITYYFLFNINNIIIDEL